MLSFAGLITLGTAALMLPAMQAPGGVSWVDCLFTATSAVCVTGLITVDTATAWSGWGQGVILCLIQLGGLGIMTFSVALLYLAGRRPAAHSYQAVRGALGPIPASELGRVIKDVVVYTAVTEGLGAAVLWWRFGLDYGWARGLALGVFHSISAFCNAGFSMFSTSLMAYRADPTVNLAVMGLITAGGIGFLVIEELLKRLRTWRQGRRPPRLSLHTRMVLTTSGVLVLGGAGVLWIFEYIANHGQVWGGSLWPVFFTAVTPRTAGFNTIPMNALSNASVALLLGLMFVGASPGSCGGGVKTTTLAVLVSMVRTHLRGRRGAEAWGRRVEEGQVGAALSLVLGSLALLGLALMVLLSLHLPKGPLGHQRGEFLVLCFEAVSAFGTVGLSLGATAKLTTAGKLVVIMLMFIGRVGPLSFVYSIAQRMKAPRYRLAEEHVLIG